MVFCYVVVIIVSIVIGYDHSCVSSSVLFRVQSFSIGIGLCNPDSLVYDYLHAREHVRAADFPSPARAQSYRLGRIAAKNALRAAGEPNPSHYLHIGEGVFNTCDLKASFNRLRYGALMRHDNLSNHRTNGVRHTSMLRQDHVASHQ